MDMITSNSAHLLELKNKYIELITKGYVEAKALEVSGLPKGVYLRLMLEDVDFNQQVESARKLRAEFWVAKIAEDIDQEYTSQEIPSQRLKFDKLQFLAKADNPDRYGTANKKIDISVDLKQFKLLPPEEAIKALAADPFAPVEAEFTELPKEDDLL
jgi:hypothetical protein